MEYIFEEVFTRLDRTVYTKKEIGRELGLIRKIELTKNSVAITYEAHSNAMKKPEEVAKSEIVRDAINRTIQSAPNSFGAMLAREMAWISFLPF